MATAASLLTDISTALRPLIQAEQGRLDVASSLDHALEILGTAVNRWRVVLLWNGHGSHQAAIHGMSSARFTTFIHQSLGLPMTVGDKVFKGDAAFLARMEQVSRWCRALRWPDGHGVACEGLALEDSEWVDQPPKHTAAHGLTWALEYALEYQPTTIVIPAPA